MKNLNQKPETWTAKVSVCCDSGFEIKQKDKVYTFTCKVCKKNCQIKDFEPPNHKPISDVDKLINHFLSSDYFNKDWEAQYGKLKKEIQNLLTALRAKDRKELRKKGKRLKKNAQGSSYKKEYNNGIDDFIKLI